jgi:hypothetical protein
MEAAMARKRGISVKDLYGGRFMSPAAVQRSMAGLEKRLDAEFKAQKRLTKQFNEPIRKYRKALAVKNQASGEATREMLRLHKLVRGLKVQRSRPAKVNTGILTGLNGATVAPPYDYQWTWGAVDGNAYDHAWSADRRNGRLFLELNTAPDDSSSLAGRAAVGIYFYPPTSGLLHVWSAPAFDYMWGTFCSFASAHADGWIGLYVGRYDLAGAFIGDVIDQRITLWSDDSWLYGSRGNPGSSSGYGLYPPPIQVDRQHQYIIWVWCGGKASAEGWHALYGSGALNTLNVGVPSISWELRATYEVEAAGQTAAANRKS